MKKSACFFGVMTLLVMGFILSNSLRAGTDSSQQSSRVMALLVKVFPFLPRLFGENLHHFVRKLAHFTEFAALGFFTAGFLRSLNFTKTKYILGLVYLALVPALDETLQIFTPDRGPSVRDAALDFSGAVTGFAGMLLIWKIAEMTVKYKKREK